MNNLFSNIPPALPEELVEILASGERVRIERIISNGQASPEGFWYSQDDAEWVVLLQGAARLQFDHGAVDLQPGDFISIPARQRHRVEWTAPDQPTIWLAVHYRAHDQTAQPPTA